MMKLITCLSVHRIDIQNADDTFGEGSDTGQDNNPGDDIGNLAFAQEVDLGILESTPGHFCIKGDVSAPGQHTLVNQASEDDGGEQGGQDTNHQRGGKTLDGSCSEEEEETYARKFVF